MKKLSLILLSLISVLLFSACGNANNSILKGCYQSGRTSDNHIITISIYPDKTSFIQYIDQREVNLGTYDELKDKTYSLNGNNKSIDISLSKENTFELTIKNVNDGNPIKMKNIDEIPVSYSSDFDDVNDYISLLKD
ncbi:MAG: hypothetical protein ACRC28_13060 [Clostridium sp.]|uniref:hypothetical protein n=1 Tax=Clostridium sp. TaxID=1506 RepID=UPI003F397AEE